MLILVELFGPISLNILSCPTLYLNTINVNLKNAETVVKSLTITLAIYPKIYSGLAANC